MNESRLERRVGLFILVGLVLLAVLLLLFSKGTTFYRQTYGLRLSSVNVGGIKIGANVLLSGVPVGRVAGVDLALDGKSVTIHLKIFQRYRIFEDARFEIEQFGFLGDQYISIYPGENRGRELKDGEEVKCRTPFNMQEAVSKATETISRIGQAATNVNDAVSDVRKFVLTERTLTNLAGAMDRFAVLSTDALNTISNLDALVGTNALPVTITISNLNYFASQLTPLANQARELVAINEPEVTAAIKNIEIASGMLTNLLGELQTREGLAGRLLRDEQMAANFSLIASNLAVTSSNLNRLGLWAILWKPKTTKPKTNSISAPVYTGRNPFN
jgi:phospholipid/cholesterol/gamma-HCH transport system substrate-binding protein